MLNLRLVDKGNLWTIKKCVLYKNNVSHFNFITLGQTVEKGLLSAYTKSTQCREFNKKLTPLWIKNTCNGLHHSLPAFSDTQIQHLFILFIESNQDNH